MNARLNTYSTEGGKVSLFGNHYFQKEKQILPNTFVSLAELQPRIVSLNKQNDISKNNFSTNNSMQIDMGETFKQLIRLGNEENTLEK